MVLVSRNENGIWSSAIAFTNIESLPFSYDWKRVSGNERIELSQVLNVGGYADEYSFVTNRTKSEHTNNVRDILTVMAEAELQLEAGKCTFSEVEWVGFKLTSSGTLAISTKVPRLTDILRSTIFKEVRSTLGAVINSKVRSRFSDNSFPIMIQLNKRRNLEFEQRSRKNF